MKKKVKDGEEIKEKIHKTEIKTIVLNIIKMHIYH